jgi:hypothetical protein
VRSRILTLGVGLVLAALALTPSRADAARSRPRPRFEPTDLQLDDPGQLQLDLQFGLADGSNAWRLVVPDFELNLGLTSDLELDIDGAWAWEGGPSSDLFDHTLPDNLWVALKLGMLTVRDEEGEPALSVGVQLGPKLPASPGSSGIGFEGLLLVGHNFGHLHLVVNLGGKIDPDAGGGRPEAVEGGLDATLDLGEDGHFSISAALAGTVYFSSDPTESSASVGFTWSPSTALDLSVTSLVGFTSGSDHFAVLFGASPKVNLW